MACKLEVQVGGPRATLARGLNLETVSVLIRTAECRRLGQEYVHHDRHDIRLAPTKLGIYRACTLSSLRARPKPCWPRSSPRCVTARTHVAPSAHTIGLGLSSRTHGYGKHRVGGYRTHVAYCLGTEARMSSHDAVVGSRLRVHSPRRCVNSRSVPKACVRSLCYYKGALELGENVF